MNSQASAANLVVLDTQVVLDAWVFGNASTADLVAGLEQGQLHWRATASMRAELQQVLRRPMLTRWRPDEALVLGHFDRLSRLCPEPPANGAPSLRCTDPDDQVFIDLAVQERAGALFTRDKALLRLRKRAAGFGISIVAPSQSPHLQKKEEA